MEKIKQTRDGGVEESPCPGSVLDRGSRGWAQNTPQFDRPFRIFRVGIRARRPFHRVRLVAERRMDRFSAPGVQFFVFLQNFAQIYVSLSRLFGLEVLFRGFLCGMHAFVSSSCTFCTHSYLCVRSLSRVAAVFRLQNSVRTSVSASRLPWRKTVF